MAKKTLFLIAIIAISFVLYFALRPCDNCQKVHKDNKAEPANAAPINAQNGATGSQAVQKSSNKPQSPCINTANIRPDIQCPESDKPVCGCDGVTYKNACEAFKKGLSSIMPGSCKQ